MIKWFYRQKKINGYLLKVKIIGGCWLENRVNMLHSNKKVVILRRKNYVFRKI